MSWIAPTAREVVPQLRRLAGLSTDRHAPGYWRDYHRRNVAKRRPYLTRKAREYRASRRAA